MRISLRSILLWILVIGLLFALAVRIPALAVFLFALTPALVFCLHRTRSVNAKGRIAQIIIGLLVLFPAYVASTGPIEMFRVYCLNRGHSAAHTWIVRTRKIAFSPIPAFPWDSTLGEFELDYYLTWGSYGDYCFPPKYDEP
jgi:hypothetical protein